MALPYMAECGWEPLILRVDPDEQGGFKEPKLVETVPPEARVWQAAAIPRIWTRPSVYLMSAGAACPICTG